MAVEGETVALAERAAEKVGNDRNGGAIISSGRWVRIKYGWCSLPLSNGEDRRGADQKIGGCSSSTSVERTRESTIPATLRSKRVRFAASDFRIDYSDSAGGFLRGTVCVIKHISERTSRSRRIDCRRSRNGFYNCYCSWLLVLRGNLRERIRRCDARSRCSNFHQRLENRDRYRWVISPRMKATVSRFPSRGTKRRKS